jgi:hypothetical protein
MELMPRVVRNIKDAGELLPSRLDPLLEGVAKLVLSARALTRALDDIEGLRRPGTTNGQLRWEGLGCT